MVTLPPWPVSTDFGTCSYQCFLSNCTPVSLHMLKCSCAHTLSCLFTYCSFASIGHADSIWSIVSSNCWHSLHLLFVSVFNIIYYYYYYYYYYYITSLFHYHVDETTLIANDTLPFSDFTITDVLVSTASAVMTLFLFRCFVLCSCLVLMIVLNL